MILARSFARIHETNLKVLFDCFLSEHHADRPLETRCSATMVRGQVGLQPHRGRGYR